MIQYNSLSTIYIYIYISYINDVDKIYNVTNEIVVLEIITKLN